MKGQQYLKFDRVTTAMVTGDWTSGEEMVVPLFKELSKDEEQPYRDHARANYVVGTEIETVFHPIWQDECRRMNEEAGLE